MDGKPRFVPHFCLVSFALCLCMLRIALTGGIASGKSHCVLGFAALGVPVIDADEIVRDVERPGSPALSAIAARFGPSMLDSSGTLDRQALANVVFADA